MAAPDFTEFDRRAVRASVAIVSRLTAADLGSPTPCADWTLGELLAHMTAQHHGFAAAAAGQGSDLAVWQVGPLGADPVADYAAAAELVIAAFAEPGAVERRFSLPEISPTFRFPAAQAISFHFVDYVVHGWDAARSLGIGYQLDDDLAEAALTVATVVPDGPQRLEPGAAFGPGLAAPEDASPLDRALSMLGRSPLWPDDGQPAGSR